MRSIPIQMMDHLGTGVTSLAKLFKMRCRDGAILTFTSADHDIRYTDGPDGALLYQPHNSLTPSALKQAASLGVDNAELSGFVDASGITEQQIRSGIFSGARFWVYVVDYLDLTRGHYIWASGKCGQTKFSDMEFWVETRSKQQQLKQPISESYMLTCTVGYGSTACGKSLSWQGFTVTDVDDAEPDRILTIEGDDLLASPAYRYGVVHMLTGDNAGAEVEVELHGDDGEIELLLPLPYPLAPDDEGEIRIDCNKEARDADYGCKSELRWGAQWPLHHRGFPDIPVANQGSLLAPGAQTPSVPGSGAVTSMEAE